MRNPAENTFQVNEETPDAFEEHLDVRRLRIGVRTRHRRNLYPIGREKCLGREPA
jgi:hypothetical protein